MIGLADIQNIVADSFFNGDTTIAGLVMFMVVLGILFTIFNRNVFTALLLALPTVLIFSLMGVLSSDMTILLIIITVLGLGVSATTVFDFGYGKKK